MIELQNICFEYGSEEQNIAGRGALHNINLHISRWTDCFIVWRIRMRKDNNYQITEWIDTTFL